MDNEIAVATLARAMATEPSGRKEEEEAVEAVWWRSPRPRRRGASLAAAAGSMTAPARLTQRLITL